jgi:hypothetical protein
VLPFISGFPLTSLPSRKTDISGQGLLHVVKRIVSFVPIEIVPEVPGQNKVSAHNGLPIGEMPKTTSAKSILVKFICNSGMNGLAARFQLRLAPSSNEKEMVALNFMVRVRLLFFRCRLLCFFK